MAIPEKLQALVNRLPDPDEQGMFTENIDKQEIDEVIAAISAGGREYIVGLVDMLGEPGSDEDVKPHYALHCAANRALIAKDEAARQALCEVLAAELSHDRSDYVKRFLCQELQWAGRQEATPALGKLLLEEELVEAATMALVAIREGAAEQFRAALPAAVGKCRLNIIQGLGAVEDPGSADVLRQSLGDLDEEIRLAAGWGLAQLGDAGSVDQLINAADVDSGWERIQATKHCLLLAEKLRAAGKHDLAAKIYTHLRDTRTQAAERYIRDAAARALN